MYWFFKLKIDFKNKNPASAGFFYSGCSQLEELPIAYFEILKITNANQDTDSTMSISSG